MLRALEAARRFASAAGLEGAAADRLAIVVEEWIGNIVEHGAVAPGSRIALTLVRGEACVRLVVSDAGAPFDPRAASFEGPNEDRGGGVGLALVAAWTRVAAYRRRRGRNHVVLEMPCP